MPKISKIEALRRGDTIEDTPGVYARLNPEKKSIEYSTGETSYIGNNENYFPSSEQSRKASLEREKIEDEIKRFPLGAGELAYQFGQKGSFSGGLGDIVDRVTNPNEDYLAKKSAKQQVSSRISNESPITSGVATAASFIPDIMGTKGMSATKAAPMLTVAGAGSRAYDEPGQVAGEALLAGGAGFILDKGMKVLSKTASRRGASRKVAQEAEEVGVRNLAGAEASEAESLAKREAFKREAGFVERENQAQRHQYNLDSTARENEMIQARNAYENARVTNSAEREALKNEYQQAQQSYNQALSSMPEQQRMAQQQISERASKYYDSVVNQIPKDSTISTSGFAVEEFIDSNINKGIYANTKEGREASKIISSMFGESENLTGQELATRLRAFDTIIERSPRETQVILDQFKRTMGRNVGREIASDVLHREMVPILRNSVKADVKSAFSNFKPSKDLGFSRKELVKVTSDGVENAIAEMSPQQLAEKLRAGTLVEDVMERTLPRKRFIRGEYPKEGVQYLKDSGIGRVVQGDIVQAQTNQYNKLYNELASRIEESIANAEMKASQSASKARQITNRRFREAYGVAEPVQAPMKPVEPSYPQAPQAPQQPPSIPQPVPQGMPQQPISTPFIPEQAPTLPTAQGGAEVAGDFLERPLTEMIKGKGFGDFGTLGNLAKLNYLMSGKGFPAGAAYGALKGATSPTAMGEAFRGGMQMGGLAGIVSQISSSFQSYDRGVLTDPQERKMVVAQIESDPDVGIEDKAIIQAYVNRGKNLETLVEVENGY